MSDWHGPPPSDLWPLGSARYFAVDYDGGNDSNVGFSDTSLALAGVVPLKTLTRLRQILPPDGEGRVAVVGIKRRAAGATYLKPDGVTLDWLDLSGYHGYASLVVRGTDTQASASSVAFANDAADRKFVGAQVVAGTESYASGGYTCVAGSTTFVILAVKTTGAAPPAYAAEPTLLGKRVRFDSATPTVALRNATSMIWMNDAATLTVGNVLPAAPVAGDIFYIEEPGVQVDRVFAVLTEGMNVQSTAAATTGNTSIVGIRAINAGSRAFSCDVTDVVTVCFCEATSASGSAFLASFVRRLSIANAYPDETGVFVTPGVGFRTNGGMSLTAGKSIGISTSYTGLRVTVTALQLAIGSASVFAQGVQVAGGTQPTAQTGAAFGGFFTGTIGRANSTTTAQRLRITSNPGIGGVTLTQCDVRVWGCDITGQGAQPCIYVNGEGSRIGIDDNVGTTGNTSAGLSLTDSRDCMILAGIIAASTISGTVGDIIAGAGTIYVAGWTDLTRTDIRDSQGNHLKGTAGVLLADAIMLLTNDGNANIVQYNVVRPTGSGVVRAAIASAAATAIAVGVCQQAFTAAGPQKADVVTAGGTWIQFDAAPTAGNIAYLSTATAGQAQDTVPAVAGTNQKLRLGRIIKVSGTLGFVDFHPETLAVLADGLA